MHKYIKFSDGTFKVFSEDLKHSDETSGKESVSAGFICSMHGEPKCVGASTSLNLVAGESDSREFMAWLDRVELCK